MTTKQPTAVNNTAKTLTWKSVVSTVIAFAIAWVTTKASGWNLKQFATEWALITPAYLAGVSWLEAHFPKFSWLFALLPKVATPAAKKQGSKAVK